MKHRFLIHVAIIAPLICLSLSAHSAGGDDDSSSDSSGGGSEFIVKIQKKQDNKYKNRWTLANWFEQQRKVRLMDQWLAANTAANDFEFFVAYEGAQLTQKDPTTTPETTTASVQGSRAMFAAYATLVGLEGHLFTGGDIGSGWDALFNLRLLGASVQSTNLTIGYGLRNRKIVSGTVEETWQNHTPKASLTFYFFQHFGIEGVYRKLTPIESNLKTTLEGDITEATAFIDFNFVRPYGTWYKENLKYTTSAGVETKRSIEAVFAGLKLFF